LESREELLGKLGKLSLEEKVSPLTGADYWTLRGHPGIGLRPVRASAAAWDPRRAELIGSLLAAECRGKNVGVGLGTSA
jgi:hypothetical protein